MICWGAATSAQGQVGTVFAVNQSVSSCASATCLAVSAASFISFSDGTSPSSAVEQVSAGELHTCVLFVSGRTLCFGSGSQGQTGIGSTASVSGPLTGPLLATQPLISFSDNSLPLASLSLGFEFSCAIRCDGRVICFGANSRGQLGLGLPSAQSQGDAGGEMSALATVGLNTANVPITAPQCTLRLLRLVESSGQLANFSPHVTAYLFSVEPAVSSLTVSAYSTYPSSALLSVNDLFEPAPVPLGFYAVNQVTTRQHIMSIKFLQYFLIYVFFPIARFGSGFRRQGMRSPWSTPCLCGACAIKRSRPALTTPAS